MQRSRLLLRRVFSSYRGSRGEAMNSTDKKAIYAALEECSASEAGRISRAFYILNVRLGGINGKLADDFGDFGIRAEVVRDDKSDELEAMR